METPNKKIKEMSGTGGGAGAASFSPGQGAQYATPYAFRLTKKMKKLGEANPGATLGKGPKAGASGVKNNYYTQKLGFKPVNSKKLASQSKAIDTKYLWGENNMYKYKLSKTLNEADPARIQFQEKRIAAFKEIEEKLNNLYPIIDNAKKETIAYYKDQPQSYAVVIPTDLVLEYLNDIESLLKQNDR